MRSSESDKHLQATGKSACRAVPGSEARTQSWVNATILDKQPVAKFCMKEVTNKTSAPFCACASEKQIRAVTDQAGEFSCISCRKIIAFQDRLPAIGLACRPQAPSMATYGFVLDMSGPVAPPDSN